MSSVLITPVLPFDGYRGEIQEESIQSFLKLSPHFSVLAVSEFPQALDFARGLGCCTEPLTRAGPSEPPRVSDIFKVGFAFSNNSPILYANSDLRLEGDFGFVSQLPKPFFITGSHDGGRNSLDWFYVSPECIDDIPDFYVGRFFWDTWLPYAARKRGIFTLDASSVVYARNLDHPDKAIRYKHHQKVNSQRLYGFRGVGLGDPHVRANYILFSKNFWVGSIYDTEFVFWENQIMRRPLWQRFLVKLEHLVRFIPKRALFAYRVTLFRTTKM